MGGFTTGALIAIFAVLMLFAEPGAAKTFKPTRLDDVPPGRCTKDDCTLREAVLAANKRTGRDTIRLQSGETYVLSVAGSDEDEGETGDLDALGRTSFEVTDRERATIDANGIDRVLHVLARTQVDRLILTGGLTTQPGEAGLGLFSPFHRIDVRRTRITGNTGADNSTGGAYLGGGGSLVRSQVSFNEGTNTGGVSVVGDSDRPFLVDRTKITGNVGGGMFVSSGVVRKSTIRDNEAVQCGGVDLNAGTLRRSRVIGNKTVPFGGNSYGGGGVCLGSGSRIVGSTISGNFAAADGGGVEVFGGKAIVGSTIAGNTANDEGGGVSVLFSDPFVIERSTFYDNVAGTDGGGLRAGSARVIVQSSTFQGNEGVLGGGIVANDQPTGASDSVVDLRWSTLSDNNSGSGGGIGSEDGGSYLAKGTLIDGNLGVAGATDCDATVVSLGHNFIGNPTGCATFDHPSDDGGTPALLGPLADNGGRTLTMKPAAGSPVIDAGGNDCPPADQRGRPRPRGEACDVGAVEAR